MKKKNLGFSLTEIIIVVGILAVLVTALTPTLIKYINKAQKAVDISNAQTIAEVCHEVLAEDDDAYYGFYGHQQSNFRVVDTTDPSNPDSYVVAVTVRWNENANRWVAEDTGASGNKNKGTDFLDAFMLRMYGTTDPTKKPFRLHYKKDPSKSANKGKPTSYLICLRRHNEDGISRKQARGDEPLEIWIGTAPEHSGWCPIPTYKVYPTVCSEYED